MIRKIAIGLCLAVMCFSLFQIGSKLYEYYQAKQAYSAITKEYVKEVPAKEKSKKKKRIIDFDALMKRNPDTVAWIWGEDTQIDYPVVRGDDNIFYLKHNFEKNYQFSGCIFMDSANKPDFSDPISILYGHHMRDGSMFAGITKYKDNSYYKKHKTLHLYTKKQEYEIKLFAGGVYKGNDDIWKISFGTDEEYEKWLGKIQRNSTFESGITPKKGDKLCMLSTCSYEFDDARYIVVGILKKVK